jgi:hypothetical protein
LKPRRCRRSKKHARWSPVLRGPKR